KLYTALSTDGRWLGWALTIHDITMKLPEGLYYLRGVPYKEQNDSLMSDISKQIPGPDLKKITRAE
ncbi:MAG: hypothetical protein WKG03_16055, partial [Telluria sp.]